ncbi:hypothetical protein OG904_27755 [Streptomyces sp. NBC_00096]
MDADLAEPAGGPLPEEEAVIAGRNFRISVMLTWTVPSSRGSPGRSRATQFKWVSACKPLASMASQRRVTTCSASVVTFVLDMAVKRM